MVLLGFTDSRQYTSVKEETLIQKKLKKRPISLVLAGDMANCKDSWLLPPQTAMASASY